MNKCLNCQHPFESKTGRRKFCSDKCKMQHFRKHGKNNMVTKSDIQALLNEVKTTIDEFKAGIYAQIAPANFDAGKRPATYDEPMQWQETKPKIRRSYDWYVQARKDCQTIEQWNELKELILEDEFLTSNQKYSLTQKPVI